jgi:hypothetical protein
VFPQFTAALQKQLTALGAKLTYKTYPGVNHGGIPAAADADALAFARAHLR